MAVDYECPNCKAPIANKQIYFAAGFAFCSKCKTTYPCARPPAPDKQFGQNPPRFVKVEKDFRGVTKITYRVISFIALLFLIPFTALWTWFTVWGIYVTQFIKNNFILNQSLFGIPFVIVNLLLLFIIAFELKGKWIIVLDNGTGTVFVGIAKLGWCRVFYYNKNSTITLLADVNDFNAPSYQITKWIKINTNGNDFLFGSGINNKAKNYIAALIACIAKTV